MGSDLGKEPVKSGIGRSRRRSSASGQREVKRIPKLSESIESEHRKNSRKAKKRRRIIVMIIAECFTLLFLCGYGFVARRWNMIQRVDDWVPEEVENPNFSVDLPQYQKQKGHWGIYIFGVDSRGSNLGKETNADVNMICDINHDTGEIRLVSVYRDSYLSINDSGSCNKINRAYFDGGPSNAARMLNKNLDLNISDFMTFSWKAVADGINLLGGVDMEITRAEFAYINSFITETVEATGVYSQHLKSPGMNHLDGVQAVAYGRLRLMDTDFARTERQRKVIQAAFEKAKVADLNTLNQLTLILFPQVATSVDMQDIISLLGDVGKYYIGETGGFPFTRGDTNMGNKGACVIPQTLESNVIELHRFLYGEENYILSDTVKQISAKISSDTGMYSKRASAGRTSADGGVASGASKASGGGEDKAKETRGEGKSTEGGKEGIAREGEDGQEDDGSGRIGEDDGRDGSRSGDEEGGREGTSARETSGPEESSRETRPSSVILPPGGGGNLRPADFPAGQEGSGGSGNQRPSVGGHDSYPEPSGANLSGTAPSAGSQTGNNPSGTNAANPGSSGNNPSGTNPVNPGSSGNNPSGTNAANPGSSGNNPSGTNPVNPGSSGNNPSGTNPVNPGSSGNNPSGANAANPGSSGNNPSGANTANPGSSGNNPSGTNPVTPGLSGNNPSGSSNPVSPGAPASNPAASNETVPDSSQGVNIITIPAGPEIS